MLDRLMAEVQYQNAGICLSVCLVSLCVNKEGQYRNFQCPLSIILFVCNSTCISPSRLCDGDSAPVALALADVAAVRADELGDVGDAEADAVVGEGGADDGQLGADGQHQLVVDHGLRARDRQLLRAQVVLQRLALVAAHLERRH